LLPLLTSRLARSQLPGRLRACLG